MSEFSIIITAGGIGKRMGTTIPKQFIEIGGKPILIRTLEIFHSFDPNAQIIVTLPKEWQNYWTDLLKGCNCSISHTIVDGGDERYHSIKNALKHCNGSYIAVHDGVRPFVSYDTLKRCFEAVKIQHQIVPVIPIKESIRKKTDQQTIAVNRTEYVTVQTPQCFLKATLEKAYEHTYHEGVTDDATLVEHAGFPIYLVDGNEENIKVTSKIDLLLAEKLCGI